MCACLFLYVCVYMCACLFQTIPLFWRAFTPEPNVPFDYLLHDFTNSCFSWIFH